MYTTVLDSNYIVNGVTNGNNEVDRITSIVIGLEKDDC